MFVKRTVNIDWANVNHPKILSAYSEASDGRRAPCTSEFTLKEGGRHGSHKLMIGKIGIPIGVTLLTQSGLSRFWTAKYEPRLQHLGIKVQYLNC
jgi:hypothetical protein